VALLFYSQTDTNYTKHSEIQPPSRISCGSQTIQLKLGCFAAAIWRLGIFYIHCGFN